MTESGGLCLMALSCGRNRVHLRLWLIRNLILLAVGSVLTVLAWLLTWVLSRVGDVTGAAVTGWIAALVSGCLAAAVVVQVTLLSWLVLQTSGGQDSAGISPVTGPEQPQRPGSPPGPWSSSRTSS